MFISVSSSLVSVNAMCSCASAWTGEEVRGGGGRVLMRSSQTVWVYLIPFDS